MKVIHRISARIDQGLMRKLHELGVEIVPGLTSFEVSEDHPNWGKISELMHGALDVISTKFSSQEIAAATGLRLEPQWHWGYPQPEKDRGYLSATYDLSAYCGTCGIGAVQRAPFKIKGEPRWGRRDILQLNWIFDEYFVPPAVWEEVFASCGVGYREVLDSRSGNPARTVVQVKIDQLAPGELQLGGHEVKMCQECGRKKYLPYTRGCFPETLADDGLPSAFRSREYFGDGALGYQAITVTGTLADRVRERKLSGVSLTPVCQVVAK